MEVKDIKFTLLLQVIAQITPSGTWSGATNHITADINNLAIKSDYKGKDWITVGNGQTLKISRVGSAGINSHTTSHPLTLKNILLFPKITENLFSISMFTSDNNAVVEFFPDHCFVKDKN